MKALTLDRSSHSGMRTRRSKRSLTPSAAKDLTSSEDEAPEEVPQNVAQEESTKRRNDERAAEAANKSAKKARNAGHSVATAARAQDAAAAAAAEPSSVAMTGDMHVSASDGEEFAEPPVQTSVASTPHVSIATVPASQAAFGKSSEGRTQIGDQNLTADERNDDQLPDSVVQELLKQQRSAADAEAERRVDTKRLAVVGRRGISRTQGARKHKAINERQKGPVTVKALSAHPILPPSDGATAFLKDQLSGPHQQRSKVMLLSASEEEAQRRYAPRNTKKRLEKGPKGPKHKPGPAWK